MQHDVHVLLIVYFHLILQINSPHACMAKFSQGTVFQCVLYSTTTIDIKWMSIYLDQPASKHNAIWLQLEYIYLAIN